LAEGQPTPAEPHKDSAYVVGFSRAAGQSQRLRSASGVDTLVSEMARDLGVVINSQLPLSAQVAAMCLSGYYQLRQLRPLVSRDCKDAGSGIYFGL